MARIRSLKGAYAEAVNFALVKLEPHDTQKLTHR